MPSLPCFCKAPVQERIYQTYATVSQTHHTNCCLLRVREKIALSAPTAPNSSTRWSEMLRQTNDPKTLAHNIFKVPKPILDQTQTQIIFARASHFHQKRKGRNVTGEWLLLPVTPQQFVLLPSSHLLPREFVLLSVSHTYHKCKLSKDSQYSRTRWLILWPRMPFDADEAFFVRFCPFRLWPPHLCHS